MFISLKDVELKHTWRISRDAWYIRLYLWVWEAEERDITFCKLWWAYIFMWIGLPIKCFIVSVAFLLLTVHTSGKRVFGWFKLLKRTEDQLSVPESRPAPVQETTGVNTYALLPSEPSVVGDFLRSVKPSRPKQFPIMHSLLTGIETVGLKMGMQVQKASYWLSATGRPIKAFLSIVGSTLLKIAKPVAKNILWLSWTLLEGLVVSFCALVVGLYLGFSYIGKGLFDGFCYIEDIVLKASPTLRFILDIVLDGVEYSVKVIWVLMWPIRKLCWYGVIVPGDKFFELLGTSTKAEKIITWSSVGVIVATWLAVPIIIAGVFVARLVANPFLILPILAITAGVTIIGLFLGWALSRFLARTLAPKAYRYVVRPTVSYSTDTTVSFGRMMVIGIKSVKANSCPKVEIED